MSKEFELKKARGYEYYQCNKCPNLLFREGRCKKLDCTLVSVKMSDGFISYVTSPNCPMPKAEELGEDNKNN